MAKSGPGQKPIQDQGRLQRIAELVVSGKAKSPWAAAALVAEEDPGDYPSNTRRRIYDKYRSIAAELEAEARLVYLSHRLKIGQSAERSLAVQAAIADGLRQLLAAAEEIARQQGFDPQTAGIVAYEALRERVPPALS